MGYNVYYAGVVKIDKPLDEDTYNLIKGLNESRRMILDVKKLVADGLAKKEEVGQWGSRLLNSGRDHCEICGLKDERLLS